MHSQNWHCCHLRPKCSYGCLGTQSWRKTSGLATWKIMSGCGKHQWLSCCPLDPGGHQRIRRLTVTYQKSERQVSWLAGIHDFSDSWGFYLKQNKDGANNWYYKGRSGGWVWMLWHDKGMQSWPQRDRARGWRHWNVSSGDSGTQVTPGSSLITDPARNWRHPQTVARVTTLGKSKKTIFQVRNQ